MDSTIKFASYKVSIVSITQEIIIIDIHFAVLAQARYTYIRYTLHVYHNKYYTSIYIEQCIRDLNTGPPD